MPPPALPGTEAMGVGCYILKYKERTIIPGFPPDVEISELTAKQASAAVLEDEPHDLMRPGGFVEPGSMMMFGDEYTEDLIEEWVYE